MRILHLTPGAGQMFCGGCFRDNALVRALRRLGHDVLMVPLYLPPRLDEPDESAGTPIFFSGINVYLEQHLPWFRHAPRWLHRSLASTALLRWIGRYAAKTRAASVGDLTQSMLRGEEGHQARETAELIAWLNTQVKPEAICLSNSLLIGMARRLKTEFRVPILCTFQGEDGFLDDLPDTHRESTWQLLRERSRDIDLFLAPSRYAADLMRQRLQLPTERVRVIYNGIDPSGYYPERLSPVKPTLGFFARLCCGKGLDVLVEAFVQLKQRNRVPDLRLKLGGSLGPADQPLVDGLKAMLHRHGLGKDVEFCPNLDQAGKQAFLRSLSVFSVPTAISEVFGLYLLEAMASGVPVVQPRRGAFPELIDLTGGGIVYEPTNPLALTETLEALLMNPEQARALGAKGRQAVHQQFNMERMAREMAAAYGEVARFPAGASV